MADEVDMSSGIRAGRVFKGGIRGEKGACLVGFWMNDSLKTHIVNEDMRKIVSRWREGDV